MKFKIIVLSFLCLFIMNTNVDASSFSDFYPGGKNYLEYDNFQVGFDIISTIDDVRVKSDTTYTLSIPGDGSIDNPYFLIESNNTTYIDDYASNLTSCDYGLTYTSCTFTTTETDEYLSIELSGMFLSGMFTYYNGVGFQLEEGPIRTAYEEYIIPLMDSNNPEFSGNAAFIMAYYDNYDLNDIIENHIVVIDDIDGDISHAIEIISDEYTPNKHVVGEYLVELKASDQSGNTAYFNLTIIIKDEVLPSILGPAAIIVNIEDALTIEDIITDNYSGVDGFDVNTIVTVIADLYTTNSDVLGNYEVTLSTEDSSGNQASKDILIEVVDNLSPTLISSNMINVYMSESKEISEIISDLSITDNYYSDTEITKTILLDEYSINSSEIGSYTVQIQLEDGSNNTATITLYVNVIDDIIPVILGPASYTISYTESYTLDQIIELFTVSDNYDNLTISDITVTENTYTSRSTDTGLFMISFEVSDSSSNTANHTLEISVIDDQAPIIYIDDYLVTLSENASFSPEDALSILLNNHEIPNKTYSIKVLNDEYSGNEDNPGTYLYSLVFTDDEGTSIQKDFVVKVQEEESVINSGLVIRNIIVYGVSIVIVCYVVYKNKK